MTHDEWAEGAPYWKAPGSKPSDAERSVWGQGSWDSEMARRQHEHRHEDHDVEDSVQLLISLTAGKAEKSARCLVDKLNYALREAQHFKHRTTISERRAAALNDELHETRRDLARLRDELERANAWGAGVQADNDTLRRDLARARDERDEARHALQCFERIVLNGGNNGEQPSEGQAG